MKIAIACDHGALALKEAVKAHLTARGMECVDFGTFTKDSCDYPDFARPAAEAVASGACERGIVMCTTGIGVSITANKVHGIRCALLSDPVSARLTREHNDANMMPLPAQCCRYAQTIVKMEPVPTGPVAALSERPVQGN